MNLRVQIRCLAGSLTALSLAVTGLADDPDPAERVVLQLPFTHQFQFAGVYAAIEQGFFKAEGLDVEVRPASAEHHFPIEEVLAGRADFGIAQGPQLIASRLEGGEVVVIAAIMQHSPRCW